MSFPKLKFTKYDNKKVTTYKGIFEDGLVLYTFWRHTYEQWLETGGYEYEGVVRKLAQVEVTVTYETKAIYKPYGTSN